MNKAELIEKVAKDVDLSKRAAGDAVNSILENITKGMKKGPVTLVGFGTFSVRKRKARIGRSPATGEVIKIKAKKVPAFKAGKTLKERVAK